MIIDRYNEIQYKWEAWKFLRACGIDGDEMAPQTLCDDCTLPLKPLDQQIAQEVVALLMRLDAYKERQNKTSAGAFCVPADEIGSFVSCTSEIV